MNLASLDLNLLLVFDAVMAERHVTRAAERVGLSQPAVSNALSRLRHRLKDELFVRSSGGMRPTARAIELAEPVRRALAELEQALDQSAFDPSTARRAFRIATNDYCVAALMPALVRALTERAPGVDLHCMPTGGRGLALLDDGAADFAISAFDDLPDRFGSALLFRDTFACVMRKGHELASAPLTLERYAAASHLLVSLRGDPRGFVDTALARRGLTRRIGMTVNQFAVAPSIIAASDMIMTMPRRMACLYVPLHDLHVTDPPLETPAPIGFSSAIMVWHQRLSDHPAHRWFRDAVVEVAGEAEAPTGAPA